MLWIGSGLAAEEDEYAAPGVVGESHLVACAGLRPAPEQEVHALDISRLHVHVEAHVGPCARRGVDFQFLHAAEVRLLIRAADVGIGLGANGPDRWRPIEARAQQRLDRQAGGRQRDEQSARERTPPDFSTAGVRPGDRSPPSA